MIKLSSKQNDILERFVSKYYEQYAIVPSNDLLIRSFDSLKWLYDFDDYAVDHVKSLKSKDPVNVARQLLKAIDMANYLCGR